MDVVIYIAALIGLMGVALSWRQAQAKRLQNKPVIQLLYLLVSLLLLWVLFLALNQIMGPEYALFFMLFHFSWLSWLVIVSRAQIKIKHTPTKTVSSVTAEKSWWYKSMVLLMAGPIALVCSIVLCLWISRLIVNDIGNQWVLTFILVPLIWGGLATWLAADRNVIRPVMTMAISTVVAYWVVA